jgi:transposase
MVERVLSNGKRVFAHAFKLALVRRCLEPGVSVAGLALEHGVNANLLRKWIGKHRKELAPVAALLPVTVRDDAMTAAPTSEPIARAEPAPCIEIECFGARVRLHGDIDARQLRIVLDALARQR